MADVLMRKSACDDSPKSSFSEVGDAVGKVVIHPHKGRRVLFYSRAACSGLPEAEDGAIETKDTPEHKASWDFVKEVLGRVGMVAELRCGEEGPLRTECG